MADGTHTQERIPENLRKLLAVAVKSVQWSYAIFWSSSTTQQGVLEWGDGYYNGEIKTRKTVPAMEIKADKMVLQRSEQLRELYQSLLEGEADQQAQRSSAVLSPEDLTDAEWYYLVCMSFVFNPGQGLPGRALANGQPIWLCNAHQADNKVFSRSLLAKSACIQTVVCFPYLDGAIELGVTDMVLEDPRIIQHIKTSLLEFSKLDCIDRSSSPFHNMDGDTDCFPAKIDHEIVDTIALGNFYSQTKGMGFDQEGFNVEGSVHEDFAMGSPDDCSIGCEHNHQSEDLMPEGINGGTSQVQSWHFMDDGFGNCVQGSMNSSDCISQVFVNQGKVFSPLKGGNADNIHLKELEECNNAKLNSMDIGNYDDMHYRRILSIFCRKSNLSIENPCFQGSNRRSSFMCWKKGRLLDGQRHQEQQVMLKKILFDVPLIHGGCSLTSQKEDGGGARLLKPESHEISVQRALPEKVTENEKFLVLQSMVPFISKIDKASILGETIEYLKDLEARVEELESCIDSAKYDERSRRNPDMVEQTSDNYENRRIDYCKRAWMNKRKVTDTEETNPAFNSDVPKDGPVYDMKVRIQEQEVLIEMRCPWRENLLLDIIDAMNNLNMDAHSVQSSNANGILTLSLQSKFRGAAVAPARMIKQTLLRFVG